MKAVILAGGQDIGKCPLSMVRPRPLFPTTTDVLIQHLLAKLYDTGVEEAVICADGKTHVICEHFKKNPTAGVKLDFHDDEPPRGTAGCIKDAEDFLGDETFLVVEGSLYLDGNIAGLIDDHRRSGSTMTIGCVSSRDVRNTPLGLYVVEPEVFDSIPPRGYFDIKEQLVKGLAQRFLDVGLSQFDGIYRRINNAHRYQAFVQEILNGVFGEGLFGDLIETDAHVWTAPSAIVSSNADLHGPIVIGPHATVEDGVVIHGPTMIGERVRIQETARVRNSVIWPDATIGMGAIVEHAVIADSFSVRVFEEIRNSVAIDRNLNFGDLQSLSKSGYGFQRPQRTRRNGLLANLIKFIRRTGR